MSRRRARRGRTFLSEGPSSDEESVTDAAGQRAGTSGMQFVAPPPLLEAGSVVSPSIPPVPAQESGMPRNVIERAGATLQELAAAGGKSGGFAMSKWVIPAVAFVLVWWLTGGLGWALVAAVVAWFAAAWFAKKSETAPAAS